MSHRWIKFWPADWKGDPALRMCSLAARGLWIELLSIAHEAEPYGHVLVSSRAPTPRQIAQIVGASERDVVKLLAELEEAGVFSRTDAGVIFSRRMVRDHGKSEEGRAAIAKRWANKGAAQSPNTPPNTPPNRGADSLEAEAEAEAETDRVLPFGQNSRARRPRAPSPTGFDEFWNLYPAKVGRQAALKAWPRAIRAVGGDAAQIVLALKARLHLFNPEFTPNPATWLNQGRWDDDPETLLSRSQRTA